VTIEVVAIPVPFPAISMCNMRNLDFTVMNTLNSLFLADPYPEHHINATDNAFVREYMRTVARYSPLWCDLSCKISSNFASVSETFIDENCMVSRYKYQPLQMNPPGGIDRGGKSV